MYNRDGECLLRGTIWVFNCDSDCFSFFKVLNKNNNTKTRDVTSPILNHDAR